MTSKPPANTPRSADHRGSQPSCKPRHGSDSYGIAIHFEEQFAGKGIGVDTDVITMQHFSVENPDSKRILDQSLQGPLEWPCPIRAIVASE